MATVIHIETFQIKPSVNTPDYTMVGKVHYDNGNWRELHKLPVLPTCDKKYWKWNGASVVEMTIEEKAAVDYVEPVPEPEPPTTEELEAERDANIAAEIAIKYPLPAEMALRWKLHIGELTMESPEIVAYRAWVDSAKAKYPKV